ncbi:MAG: DUF2752 domain-containing protein [Saprospiraceae bacterium]|nr:DUF2752 domain-containing protein [Saprospiraceae bacterium]
MNRKQLYIFIVTASIFGIGAVMYLFVTGQGFGNINTVCVFKNMTGIPCPSCGATRSVLSIMSGQFANAWYFNPLGFLLIALFALPFWVILDFITGKDSFYKFYTYCEQKLVKPQVYLPLCSLMMINWIWNLVKYL